MKIFGQKDPSLFLHLNVKKSIYIQKRFYPIFSEPLAAFLPTAQNTGNLLTLAFGIFGATMMLKNTQEAQTKAYYEKIISLKEQKALALKEHNATMLEETRQYHAAILDVTKSHIEHSNMTFYQKISESAQNLFN